MPKRKTGHAERAGGQQFAALPVRTGGTGGVQVLLVTSRTTKRWVIPKGWPMRGRRPGAAAAREAYEEAGVEGTIMTAASIGSYHYAKQVGNEAATIEVAVFLLKVERQLNRWPEQSERRTCWFSPEEAADLVAEPELAAIIRDVRHGLKEGAGAGRASR